MILRSVPIGRGVGFFVAGNGGSSSVWMFVAAMASRGSHVEESIGFECGDNSAGGNPSRDVQTVASTAADSVEAISATSRKDGDGEQFRFAKLLSVPVFSG